MQSAETELQNTIELRAAASAIAAPKPDLDAKAQKKDNFEALFKMIFRGQIKNGKNAIICWQTTIAAWMQPLQYIAHATFMQPCQCDQQPQLQETHRTTHTGTTTCCKTHRRNQSRPERPQPQPPHRRGTFHRRLQPLYTEKHKVSCSGFLPKTKPMQHSCSHYNAICNHSFRKPIELRTQEQPLVAKHIEGTNRVRNDPSRNRRTDEVPFIAGCSHFTRKNTRFRAPASSPKQSPCNIHAATTMRSATTASGNP